jgi:hypothetical protein
VSDFGDFDPDDAYDTEPADPEQVARKIQELRHAHNLSAERWDDLSPAGRANRVVIATLLLAWLRRQGSG